MLSNPGDAYWNPADPVPWGAACRSPPSDPRLAASIREGGDALGRLAGMPPLMRGSTGSTEVGPGRYTHLLYVDLQDASRSKETSREDNAELLLARFSARGIMGGGNRRMDHRVSTGFSRRIRHTPSSAHQHSPPDQVGAPDDATFGRLSISGAKRQVRTFAGLGDVADPEDWRLRIHGEHANVFSTGVEVLPPASRERGDFLVLRGQLVRTRSFQWGFSSPLRIIRGSGGFGTVGLAQSMGPGFARGII